MPWEILVVAAPQDGVAPSLLLSTPDTLGGRQYLINVPEGFARLALEHRVRPTGRLAAVFATGTGPSSMGGLPGLILRLSNDGHGEVSLVGPPGTVAHAHGLRHFIRWKHPKMYARDHQGRTSLVYRDSHVEVAAVSLGVKGWQDPWRLPPLAVGAKRPRDPAEAARGSGSSKASKMASNGEGGRSGGISSSGEESSSTSDGDEESSSEEDSSSSEEEPPPKASGRGGRKQDPFVQLHSSGGGGGRGGDDNPIWVENPPPKRPSPPGGGHIVAYLCRLVGLGAVAAVVDCPEGRAGAADELAGHPAFAPLADGRLRCAVVVHLSGPAVVSLPPYMHFMAEVAGWGASGGGQGPPVQVMVGGTAEAGGAGGGGGDELGHLASLRTLVRLNAAAPGLFPLPPDVEGGGGGGGGGEGVGGGGVKGLVHAGLLTRVLVGREDESEGDGGGARGGGDPMVVRVDRSGCPEPVDAGALREQVRRERPALAGLLEGLDAEARAAAFPPGPLGGGGGAPGQPNTGLPFPGSVVAPMGWHPAAPPPRLLAPAHPELTFLGTGCAEPSKYRGASALHLRLPGGVGLLMDAGEGTLGQMRRRYGVRGLPGALAGLRAVWISHRHADHCSGLPAVLCARAPGSPPLLVVGPTAVQRWLAEVAPQPAPTAGGVGAGYHQYTFAHCRAFDEDPRLRGCREHALQSLGLTGWQSVPVEHCSDAWALVLAGGGGYAPWWKMAYSGDTRPCPRLEQAGYGCTLLVHEATFGASLHEHAVRKRHSTTPEALGVAARMGAHRTILTHFSQRYPRLPEEEEEEVGDGTKEGQGTGQGKGQGAVMPGQGRGVMPGQGQGMVMQGGGAWGAGRAGAFPPHPPPPGQSVAAPFFLAHDGMCVGFDRLGGLPSLRRVVRCVLEEGGGGEGEGDEGGADSEGCACP